MKGPDPVVGRDSRYREADAAVAAMTISGRLRAERPI